MTIRDYLSTNSVGYVYTVFIIGTSNYYKITNNNLGAMR